MEGFSKISSKNNEAKIIFYDRSDKNGNVIEKYNVFHSNIEIEFPNDISIKERSLQEEVLARFMEKEFEEAKKNSVNLEQEFGPEINEALRVVNQTIIDYYNALGINNISLAHVLGDSERDSGSCGIRSEGSHYVFGNFVKVRCAQEVENKLLKVAQFVSTTVHELTHGVGIKKFKFSSSALSFYRQGLSINVDCSNLSESEKRFGGGSVLEEGLTSWQQIHLLPGVLRSIIGEKEMLRRQSILDRQIEKMYGNKLPKEELDFYKKTGIVTEFKYKFLKNKENYTHSGYYHPYTVFEYLKTIIPDFEKKLAQAHVHGNDKPLKDSMNQEFGVGSFELVTTNHNTKAPQVLEELKTRKNSKIKIISEKKLP